MSQWEFAALWAAFRAKDRDRVIVGVAAAFTHVAVANGSIEPAERERFLDIVAGSRLAPADSSSREQLSAAFAALASAIVTKPEAGRAECLRVLGDFAFDPMRREIIWSATRAAVIADAALDAAERRAADEIRQALQLSQAPF